ncbi:MAG: TIGR00730 family Rossman fold protein [Candidatus Lambdaproteobacteria bacterium]|nr:TIGR00730 family Rossman fold protein [Candidatus Lambdaproteobacteria bacterium]
MARICVFCGSRTGTRPEYAAAARALARAMIARGCGLVYGGGRVGLMGVIADALLSAGGEVVGVIPEFMVERELAHPGATLLRRVTSMQERKQTMIDLADAFVTLPGGVGTLDELFEVLSLEQLGFHGKPSGLLNVGGYFDALLGFMARATEEGFIREQHRAQLTVAAEPEPLLDRLLARVR